VLSVCCARAAVQKARGGERRRHIGRVYATEPFLHPRIFDGACISKYPTELRTDAEGQSHKESCLALELEALRRVAQARL